MILGIDTSCYTTSLAVIDKKGKLVKDIRQVLTVKEGERGLQQSFALFQHLQNLPVLFQNLCREIEINNLTAVCVSTTPRPVEGSYMPVFTVGQGFGCVISEARQVPLYLTSHQEGHLMAGIWSSGGLKCEEFLAVHLSGGTSEVLKIRKKLFRFEIEILGATNDLHAGQFIDRIGVEMGLPFPAGAHMEKLAENFKGEIPYLTTAVQGYNFSFSGPETAARNLLKKGYSKEAVARATEHCIATTLEKILRMAVADYDMKDVLIVGGVASNSYIRSRLLHRLGHRAVGARLHFAQASYSSDNAVGTAYLGLLQQQNQ